MAATLRRPSRSRKTHAGNNHLSELREQMGTVGEAFRDMASTAGSVATDQLDPLESYIQEKPLRSVLIAAGVGALLGVLFLRRR